MKKYWTYLLILQAFFSFTSYALQLKQVSAIGKGDAAITSSSMEYYSRDKLGNISVFQPVYQYRGTDSYPMISLWTNTPENSSILADTQYWYNSFNDDNHPFLFNVNDSLFLADIGGRSPGLLKYDLIEKSLKEISLKSSSLLLTQLIHRDLGSPSCRSGISSSNSKDITFKKYKITSDNQFYVIVDVWCDVNDSYQGVLSLTSDLTINPDKSKFDRVGSNLGYNEPGIAFSKVDDTYLMETALSGSIEDRVRSFEVRKLGTNEILGTFNIQDKFLYSGNEGYRFDNVFLDSQRYWVVVTGKFVITIDKNNNYATRSIPLTNFSNRAFQYIADDKFLVLVNHDYDKSTTSITSIMLETGVARKSLNIPGKFTLDWLKNDPIITNGRIYFISLFGNSTVSFGEGFKVVSVSILNPQDTIQLEVLPPAATGSQIRLRKFSLSKIQLGSSIGIMMSVSRDFSERDQAPNAQTYILDSQLNVTQQIDQTFIQPFFLEDGHMIGGQQILNKKSSYYWDHSIRNRYDIVP